MSELSPERKKVAMLFVAVALMAAGGTSLLKGHPGMLAGWVMVQLLLLIVGAVKFLRLKRER